MEGLLEHCLVWLEAWIWQDKARPVSGRRDRRRLRDREVLQGYGSGGDYTDLYPTLEEKTLSRSELFEIRIRIRPSQLDPDSIKIPGSATRQ